MKLCGSVSVEFSHGFDSSFRGPCRLTTGTSAPPLSEGGGGWPSLPSTCSASSSPVCAGWLSNGLPNASPERERVGLVHMVRGALEKRVALHLNLQHLPMLHHEDRHEADGHRLTKIACQARGVGPLLVRRHPRRRWW